MFIDEIKESLGLSNIGGEYRATIMGDRSIYVEGVKSIKSFSKTEIILSLNKGGIKLVGEGLIIKKYCSGDVAVCGKINLLERI